MSIAEATKIERARLLELMTELRKMRADRKLMENFVCLGDSVDYFYKKLNEMNRRLEAIEQRLSN